MIAIHNCTLILLAIAALVFPPRPHSGVSPEARAGDRAAFDFVFVISVDGLRSDAIPAGGPRRLPALHRLLRGASTLNARTDPDSTLTLPNHTSMITGRTMAGPDGHGWTLNDDPPPDETLHTRAGFEVASVFDVARGHGVRTGCFFSKSKFSLWINSYNGGREPQDMAIFRAGLKEEMRGITDEALAALEAWDRGLLFLHYAGPDLSGHEHGWDISPDSPYMQAVGEIDAELGRLLDAIELRENYRGRCAVIVTADHGGGYPFKTHFAAHMWVNYIIPFLVWAGDGGRTFDLYAMNADVRRDPSLANPPAAEPGDVAAQRRQPIRNGDAANLALHLLGLPSVPGSTLNANQDLRIRPVE